MPQFERHEIDKTRYRETSALDAEANTLRETPKLDAIDPGAQT